MSARWLALFCIFSWFTIMGFIALLNITPNIPPFFLGLLMLVGGLAGLLSLFLLGRTRT